MHWSQTAVLQPQGIPEEEQLRLEAALTPVIHTGQDQAWEETTDAALTFLLRTSLAKPGRENQGATPITLEPVKETTRIKKHVSSVMDRITKGGKIVDLQLAPETSPFMDNVGSTDSFDQELEVVGQGIQGEREEATPLGTRQEPPGQTPESASLTCSPLAPLTDAPAQVRRVRGATAERQSTVCPLGQDGEISLCVRLQLAGRGGGGRAP